MMEHNEQQQLNVSKEGSNQKFGPFLFVLFVIVWISSLTVLNPDRPRPRDTYLVPPAIQHFTFGAREVTADSLWVRALQDFDYCEKEVHKQTCISSGWLFHMLDLITDLSPHFRMPYAMGGLALTIVVNDFQGATKIFDKGIAAFPSDTHILAAAAYHALYEEKNNAKASRLLNRAADLGAPPWYRMLAVRLAIKGENMRLAEAMLAEAKANPKTDPALIKAMETRIERYRTENVVK